MKILKKLLTFLIILGLINHITYFIINFTVALTAGGQAVDSSSIVDGHYYILNHGKYIEVDQTIWKINNFLEMGLFIMWPVIIISLLGHKVLNWFEKKKCKKFDFHHTIFFFKRI